MSDDTKALGACPNCDGTGVSGDGEGRTLPCYLCNRPAAELPSNTARDLFIKTVRQDEAYRDPAPAPPERCATCANGCAYGCKCSRCHYQPAAAPEKGVELTREEYEERVGLARPWSPNEPTPFRWRRAMLAHDAALRARVETLEGVVEVMARDFLEHSTALLAPHVTVTDEDVAAFVADYKARAARPKP